MRMTIAGRPIGTDHPLFVLAEIGLNHGGSVDRALALVDRAADAGASAVKLQSLRGETLVAAHCPAPGHVTCDSLQDFFGAFELDEAAHAAVAARARSRGLAFMSTPFDERAIEMLERVGCDAYKIASGDITHLRLIAKAAATGKPLVISTGMSELSDVFEALRCARKAGARQVALLHCVSAYPVPEGDQNLRAIGTLASAFRVPVGLSDHGTNASDVVLAVAQGASLYEKHIVLEGDTDAVDAAVSATGAQLRTLIEAAEAARKALGRGARACASVEAGNRTASRRALYATRDLSAGHVVQHDDIVALRPAEGLSAAAWSRLEGRRLSRAIKAGEPFLPADIQEETVDAA